MTSNLQSTAVEAKLPPTAVKVELPPTAVVRAELPLTPVVLVLSPTAVMTALLAATPGEKAQLPPTAVGEKLSSTAGVPHLAEFATQLGAVARWGDSRAAAARVRLSPAAVEVDLHHACAGWRRENRLAVRVGVGGDTSHLTLFDWRLYCKSRRESASSVCVWRGRGDAVAAARDIDNHSLLNDDFLNLMQFLS